MSIRRIIANRIQSAVHSGFVGFGLSSLSKSAKEQ
jgi:hypothetical protein